MDTPYLIVDQNPDLAPSVPRPLNSGEQFHPHKPTKLHSIHNSKDYKRVSIKKLTLQKLNKLEYPQLNRNKADDFDPKDFLFEEDEELVRHEEFTS